GKRIVGEALALASAGYARALDRGSCDGCEANNARLDDGDIGHREMQFELVLSRVVLEEAVEVGVAAREVATVVFPGERTDINGSCHASARGERRSALGAFRGGRP